MTDNSPALLLRIFVGEYDKLNHEPLYEQIVYKARERGLAGATVTKGIMSFGATSRIHKSKILALSEDLPIVIEIVDAKPDIEEFIEELDEIFEKVNGGGLITCEKVNVTFYGAAKKDGK
jgi:PII-like signaling protein